MAHEEIHQQTQVSDQQQSQEQKQQEYEKASYKEDKRSWLKSSWMKLKNFITECKRVLIVTKKPTTEEFKTIVKVSGFGIIIIGAIGFFIQLIEILIK